MLSVYRVIEELTKELRSKEAVITELSGDKTTLTLRVEELEGQVKELSSSVLQKDKDVEVQAPFAPDSTDISLLVDDSRFEGCLLCYTVLSGGTGSREAAHRTGDAGWWTAGTLLHVIMGSSAKRQDSITFLTIELKSTFTQTVDHCN